jgi:LmbE family N-acetylglucosaminyl deacetylase
VRRRPSSVSSGSDSWTGTPTGPAIRTTWPSVRPPRAPSTPTRATRSPSAELLAEGLEPWVVREVWYQGGPDPDHAVDVTDRYDVKVAALRAHTSQVSHMDSLEGWVCDRLTTVAEAAGLPEGRLAEAFTVLRTE